MIDVDTIWARRARFRGLAAVGAVVALAALATGAALADNNNGNDAKIHLKGRVAPVCTVDGQSSGQVTATVNVGNINVPGEKQVNYPINCNAPFAYTLSSLNGGLQRQGAWPGPGEVPARLYDINVAIPTTQPGRINDTCTSAAIKSGACDFRNSGDGVAINQTATLKVNWAAPSALPSGTYSDRITFTVRLQQ